MAHKSGMKVKDANIKRLDDGTLIYSVHYEGKGKDEGGNGAVPMDYKTYEYAFDDAEEIAEAIANDFGMKKSRRAEPDLESLK